MGGLGPTCLHCLSVVTALIPKKGDVNFLQDASKLRPISVTSIVYGGWAGELVRRLAMVLETLLPEQAYAFRSGVGAQVPMSVALLRSQTAEVQGRPRYFINYDIQKCFGSIPWTSAEASLI